MNDDEHEIRNLVSTWMDATRRGDIETVLSLMTDDVIFLVPGKPVMTKEAFAANSRSHAGVNGPTFDGESEIQEIKVLGEWAWMWTRLTVTTTMPGEEDSVRSGYTLSILKKQNGRWLLARDANMLAPVTA